MLHLLRRAPGRRVAAARRALAAGLIAALAMLWMGAAPAGAADIGPSLTNVKSTISGSLTPVGTYNNSYDLTFDACVPNAATAGDTWQLTLPTQLSQFPPSFTIPNPDNPNEVWITVAIAQGVATFTLTPAGDAVNNMCFESKFSAVMASSNQLGETTMQTLLDSKTVATLTVTRVPAPPAQAAASTGKSMWFEGTDNQCRTTTAGCMTTAITIAAGDHGVVTLEDTAQPNWTFDCSSIRANVSDYTTAPRVTTPTPSRLTVLSCSPGALKVTLDTTGLNAQSNAVMAIGLSAVVPGGSGPVVYTNVAAVTETGVTQEVRSRVVSALAGGVASGAHVLIRKTDAAGRDANTAADAVLLPDGTTQLTFTVANNGTQSLTGIRVSVAPTSGTGTVTGLTCNFSGGATGTEWAGPLTSGTVFRCFATLSGVAGTHEDTATVTALGAGGEQVTASDPFHAETPITPPQPSVSVGDLVWWDSNHDGMQGSTEPGITDVTLTITRSDGEPVTSPDGTVYPSLTTTTDGDGKYLFDDLSVLPPGVHYVVTVTPPAGAVATTPQAPDSTRANDSSTGSAESTDLTTDGASDLTLDFGFYLSIDLSLTKTLVTAGVVEPGDTVTFALTPHNNGPAAALAGWSVTDLLPVGLVDASASGEGYTCASGKDAVAETVTCEAAAGLAPGADGGVITVTATVTPGATGTLRNVAYVTPATSEVPETIVLVIPTRDTDTTTAVTNNDAEAELTVTPPTETPTENPTETPTENPTESPTQTPTEPTVETPVAPEAETPVTPDQPQPLAQEEVAPALAFTGVAGLVQLVVVAALVLATGCVLLLSARSASARRRT